MSQTPQLPDYLRSLNIPDLSERAMSGIGSALPPHISIRGNRFRLIDASGNEEPVQAMHLDVAIADIREILCKSYFEYEWEPGSTEPPTCWSANGIAPSREALNPPLLPSGIQVRTCEECPKNVRGSAVSKLSGASIKACRDEKWIAVIVVGYPNDMIFRLVLTPGSFSNWRAYAQRFQNQDVKIGHVICRISFEDGKNGVLKFDVAGWVDRRSAELVAKAIASKATDIYVGRNDVPRVIAGPPVGGQAVIQPPGTQQAGVFIPAANAPLPTEGGFALPPPTAQSAPFPSTGTAPPSIQIVPPAMAASPSSPPAAGEPGKRKRRTKAEMEAARAGQTATPAAQAAQAAQTGTEPVPQQTAAGFTLAPFRPAPPPASPAEGVANGPAPQFGMSPGIAPNPDLAATLHSLMGTPPSAGG